MKSDTDDVMMLGAFLESYYRLRPVNATFTGIHDHDHRLPDWSPDGLASAVDEMRALRASLIMARGISPQRLRPHLAAESACGSREEAGSPTRLPRWGAGSESSSAAARSERGWGPASARKRIRGDMSASVRGGGGAPPQVEKGVAERDGELAIAFLDVQIAEHESDHFQRGNPSLAAGEAIFGVIALMTRPFAPIADRVDGAIARLAAVPEFLDGARRSITAGVPDEWRLKCLRECDGAQRVFGDGIQRWIALESIDHRRADHLTRAAGQAASAFEDFRRWLSGPAEAGHHPPDRSELFDLLLARGHWSDRPRAALAADAREALDEALDQLHRRARAIAPGGWPEVQQRLTDAHPTTDDYLPAYQRVWNACRERADASHLVTWPDYPIRYVPIPVHTREAAPFLYYLFYRSPAPFDRLPIHDYLVSPIERDMPAEEQLRRLRATNTSVIKLNHVVHHGAIGHHVQNYYAYAGASEIGRIAAVDCASRIGMFQGGTMAEGWACYATDLMDEIGFFTAEESLAQQHTRARLLARAVVDIGLHERSLAFEDGVALYRDRIGMSPEAARAEVCKNSMFPATAIMYWLGTESLHALRRERERVEGASFSLHRFHDRLLSFGSIPVPLVAKVYA